MTLYLKKYVEQGIDQQMQPAQRWIAAALAEPKEPARGSRQRISYLVPPPFRTWRDAGHAALSAAISLVLRLLGKGPDPADSREHVLLAVLANSASSKADGRGRLAAGRGAPGTE